MNEIKPIKKTKAMQREIKIKECIGWKITEELAGRVYMTSKTGLVVWINAKGEVKFDRDRSMMNFKTNF